ncbi:MAG: hypothetical protein KGL74_00190 [Elusimicrobia bacterium]|nr:hypothetical protein [Elusimicrobiota bacterium]MDE2509513.1 hypothetical protein [Elusimicrobiota bacterium]
MRWALLGLLLGAAYPLRAQTGPAPDEASGDAPAVVDPEAVRHQADDLRDAVASPHTTDYGVHDQAAGFFEGLVRETPLVRPKAHIMDREPVDGHVGTVDGMIATAQQRYDHYKMTSTDVPDPELDAAVVYAKKLRDEKRADFDKKGDMADNQMGVFRYAKASLEGGIVEINARMALMATRIGEAFSYATLVHEAAHARARSEGRLSPEKVIDGEVEAYRVQYRWLKIIDPSEERLVVLTVTLHKYSQLHPDDRVTAQAVDYLAHLVDLYNTGGDDAKLREYVKKLGYEDGDHGHDGGVNPAAAPMRA